MTLLLIFLSLTGGACIGFATAALMCAAKDNER